MLRLRYHTQPLLQPLFVCTSCRNHVVHRSIQHDASPPQPDSDVPTPNNKKVAAERRSKRSRALTKKSQPADSRLKLWENTLNVLKDLQSSPVLFPTGGGAPIPHATEGKPHHDDGKKKKAKSAKTPKDVELTPVPPRELELLQLAFKVIEKVLGKEAQQETAVVAEKPAKSAEKTKADRPTKREKEAKAKLDLVKKGKLRKAQPKKGDTKAEVEEAQSVLASLGSVGKKEKTGKTPGGTTEKGKTAQKGKTAEKGRTTEKGETKEKEETTPKRRGKKAMGEFTVKSVNPARLVPIPVEKEQPPVPKLSYGLDRVLFNPGVYHLQDPRSRVFNFDPYLARIMPIKEFDFNALKAYITSSKDTTLINMAAEHKKKYTGSTSSMTSTLAHFHYLLSSWRKINPAVISRNFKPDSENYTKILRAPAATFLHYKDGTYAIDADKQFDTANVLSMLGKSMEKLLTLPKEDFEKYRRTKSQELSDEEKNGPEAYHYTTMGDFMMRSQLDAYDPRVLGTGMFDLKTRAVVSIRMDAQGFQKGLGYEIRGRFGQWESFEREYYDMIRAAFIKYSLQVRMGRMDGIFVAFHNTERIFGFQYIPLTEMDLALHGTDNVTLGHREYKASIHMLNEILDKAIERYPKQPLRIHVETRPSDPPVMYFFAKPVTPEEVEAVQGANRAKVEEFERKMMGLGEEAGAEEAAAGLEEAEEAVEEQDIEAVEESVEDPEDEETKLDVWEDMMDKVEETIQNEEQGITSVRDALEHALKESGLLRNSSPEDQNRYLGMLVEALISGVEPTELPSTKESTSEVPEEDAVEESQDAAADDAVVEEGSNVAAEVPEQTAPEDVAEEETPSPSAEQTEQAETPEQTETEVQAAEESTAEPSLRELILRLAARLQPGPSEQLTDTDVQPEEEVSSDALRLYKFESILSELVTKTQENTDPSPSEPAPATSTLSETQDPTASEQQPDTTTAAGTEPKVDDLFGMIITVNNRVNGQYVSRPEKLTTSDKWIVEYAIEEMEATRAERIYQQCLKRRAGALDGADDRSTAWYQMFRGDLERYSQKGRLHRRRENETMPQFPVHVLGEEAPLEYESVFGGEVGERWVTDLVMEGHDEGAGTQQKETEKVAGAEEAGVEEVEVEWEDEKEAEREEDETTTGLAEAEEVAGEEVKVGREDEKEVENEAESEKEAGSGKETESDV
ncbi:mitochondrial protein Pet127-domain-containing protein [Schizothecium vesticola]|uniref:Mitochondrial protein Pet127-domain-containing protein n=1 Tax=Schizothecium vesticola TaxID=314040 RepID=A0AA40KD96_9PEZI|nr:mitochondrial protein Pet127-domain-containing protein [Schizothecium vesticola]